MRISVGGASKLVDRIEAAGLIERSRDPDDRRAARVKLTRAGKRTRKVAVTTYKQTLAACLDTVLSESEQREMHSFVRRLLTAAAEQG
jgi:DNA-binding MarR family transcriptional regulator